MLHDGEVVGYVTSGGYGWRAGQSLAVAWLDAGSARPGSRLQVQILQKLHDAEVVADPVYDAGDSRLRG